jgi:hypothetical protein
VTLEFAADGIKRLAEIAFQVNEKTENIGARRLYTVMEKLLEEISFDAGKRGGEKLVHRRRLCRRQAGRTGEERRPVALRAVMPAMLRCASFRHRLSDLRRRRDRLALRATGRGRSPTWPSPTSSTWTSSCRRWCSPRWPRKSFDLASYLPLALGATARGARHRLLAWPLARLLGEAAKTFVPPMMFNNSGNMGLPLAVLAFGEAALPAAVVLFFVENFLHYSLGTWMLDHRARLWNLWRCR